MPSLTRGTKLVVASHNKGKVWEINQLLAPYGLAAVSAGELELAEPDETESTFRGNALIKARAAAEGSGLPALADDSGIEIAALDGAPGVYSANWAEPGRDFGLAMRRVHEALDAKHAWTAPSPPKANFISVLCLAWPGGEHTFYEGRVDGHVVWPPRGGNGFGYDPMFVPDGDTRTYGEMDPAEKYAGSHRTRAFAAFKREALANIEPIAATSGSATGTTLAALTAAAANLSTRDELLTFLAHLRRDQSETAATSNGYNRADILAAIETSLATASTTEPAWRTIAKALLATRGST